MAQTQKTLPHGSKTQSSNAVADAACYNEPTYSSNEGNNVEEAAAAGRLAQEHEGPSTSEVSDPLALTNQDPSLYYDMTGDKFLIIFNHYEYKKWTMGPEPSRRDGTCEDVKSLRRTFQSLGFTVYTHNDITHQEIKHYVTDMCDRDHSNTSCVAVAVMTHGLDTCLCAADTLYPVTDITDPLRTSPKLIAKPKLFFIQACREKHVKGQTQEYVPVDIPMGDDCLLLYSTYEDLVSYRHPEEGSWMIQALCKTINTHHRTMHLTKMVTLINQSVSRKKALNKKKIYKQIPVTEFDLTKFLKFYRV